MDVFSILADPGKPIILTEANYYRATNREFPYSQERGGKLNAYALCPDCKNPVVLINRTLPETQEAILYAAHAPYSVPDLVEYNQANYQACSLANPERFDSKARRVGGFKSNEVRDVVVTDIDLVTSFLESAIQIKLSEQVVEAMLRDFALNKGYEYKAINLFNLPFGFAFMTEAKDLYGCSVSSGLAAAINAKSESFCTQKVYGQERVRRRDKVPANKIRLFFDSHSLGGENGTGSVVMNVVEIYASKGADAFEVLYRQKIQFDGGKFYNTYLKRERLRAKARSYLK